MSDAPLGIPRDLCLRLSGIDFAALEQWANIWIERYKEQLSHPVVPEETSVLLRGKIAGCRKVLKLREVVSDTLQGVKKPVDDV